ncbi:hypothetical protein [Stenotrophomonas beteli]|uniref:hypothetical protein n=1 Tax=Stenotrophomonas beteli TaxID=3384461 RepID=UPI00128FAD58|nr:hypothetical protein [Stenotrophomonas maltophilia]
MKLIKNMLVAAALCALAGSALAQSADPNEEADAKEREQIKKFFEMEPVPHSTMKRWSDTSPDGTVCQSVPDIPHCEAPRVQSATQILEYTVVCTTKAGVVTRDKKARKVPAECR